MKNLKPHKINKLNNFILGYHLKDDKICDDLISYFNKSKNKEPGKVGTGVVIDSAKKSTDLSVTPYLEDSDDCIKKYRFDMLDKVIELYKKKYIHCDIGKSPWGIKEGMNIQKYKKEEAFFQWHCEVTGAFNSHRILAFMTYLNDVKKGGETEFLYQKIKIKPQKGLTLIWPTNWMFTHRGITSFTEDKYIITGWYSFI